MLTERFNFRPVAIARTPYPDKFGIPRQAGLSPSARGEIELVEPYNKPEALEGLDEFSHVWLMWIFDRNIPEEPGDWKPRVRPPRLGGNERRGVFATRAPVRPNPLGMSVVKLLSVDFEHCRLSVSGLDLADGTPIVDIKPYVPYSDSVPDAEGGFAHRRPDAVLDVRFNADAATTLRQIDADGVLRRLIEENLSLDPRPSYHDDPNRQYHMRLLDVDLSFRVTPEGDESIAEVTSISRY
ncbi:MAG: tRNA (N6-threonylcarbamoyladenosine(37)-N6)-methyltransferase TrmO [Gammaproteobacteria bacterium]